MTDATPHDAAFWRAVAEAQRARAEALLRVVEWQQARIDHLLVLRREDCGETFIEPPMAHTGAGTITNVAAFVDGWIARELEDWDGRSKDDIRASLTALRRDISPHGLTMSTPTTPQATDQQRARELHLLLNTQGAEWSHGSSDAGASCYPCSLIVSALAAVRAESAARIASLEQALRELADTVDPNAVTGEYDTAVGHARRILGASHV